MEFGGSPCGLHVDSTWTSPSYKTESFQNPWTPHGLPHKEETFWESLFSPAGTPQGLHKDSARTPQGLLAEVHIISFNKNIPVRKKNCQSTESNSRPSRSFRY